MTKLQLKNGHPKITVPRARILIMERRVYANGRLVTHSETVIPRGENRIGIWNWHTGSFDEYQCHA